MGGIVVVVVVVVVVLSHTQATGTQDVTPHQVWSGVGEVGGDRTEVESWWGGSGV